MTLCVAQFLTWRFAYNTQPRGGSGGKVPAMQKRLLLVMLHLLPFVGLVEVH